MYLQLNFFLSSFAVLFSFLRDFAFNVFVFVSNHNRCINYKTECEKQLIRLNNQLLAKNNAINELKKKLDESHSCIII